MRDTTRTWPKLGAVLAAVTITLALGGCAGEEKSAEVVPEGASSTGQDSGPEPGTGDPPADETPGDDAEESPLTGLDHDAVLTIGIDGGAAITCGYTFDPVELEGMRMISTSGWVTPEATIHLHDTTVHWEIPQEGDRLSHVLLHDGTTYAWKIPGDGGGVLADAEDGSLSELAERMQANAHDCVAFTGPASMFEVPADIEFDRFDVPSGG